MNQINLGPGWSALDFGSDPDMGVVRVSQGDQNLVVPKTGLRRLIEKLESLEQKLRG